MGLTTERGLLMLMLSPRLMLIPTSCMEDTTDLDTMVLDMDTTDIPMLTMERDPLMLSQRLMLTLTSSMVDTMDLDTMALAMDIPMVATPTTDKLSTKEKEVPAAKEKNSHPNLLLKLKSVSVLELLSLVAGKIENLPNKSKCH